MPSHHPRRPSSVGAPDTTGQEELFSELAPPPAPAPYVGHPRVVHCQEAPYDVYIGRGRGGDLGAWGNPFSHLDLPHTIKVETRDDAVDFYADWVGGRRTVPGRVAPTVDAIRRELAGRTLGCWCAKQKRRQRCHGDVLARVADGEQP